MTSEMRWAPGSLTDDRCWGDRPHHPPRPAGCPPYDGLADAFGVPATHTSGLCDFHHDQIVGPLPALTLPAGVEPADLQGASL